MDDVSFLTLLWLFGLALVAGIVDAMAGGGGLLTVPGLMATGLHPLAAMATNKFQGVFGPLSATIHFWRKGRLKLKDHIIPALAAFVGSFLGAGALSLMNPDTLKILVPFLLVAIAFWVLLSPKLGEVQKKARITLLAYALGAVLLVGFYDGFIGPGAGSFYALSAVMLLGLTLDEATMRAKIYNFCSNFGALLFFLIGGHINWLFGVVMAAGTILGGNIGARMIICHGTKLVKPMLVIMSLAMSGKLLWQHVMG